MARPSENSLKYYNRDTKDDDNLQYVEAMHELIGYAIVDKLWKHIYGCPGGYYCEWSEINQRLFCKNNGISIEKLFEILNTCFEEDIEIFSREMYEKHKILTSSGVQKRWLKIVKEAGRKNCHIKEEYRIIDIDAMETTPPVILKSVLPPDNPTAAIVSPPVTPPETTQSKVKENKVKENKLEQGAPAEPAHVQKTERRKRKENFIPPTRGEVQKLFIEKISERWGESKSKTEADECFDHYTANGWIQGKGKPIVDWEAACRNWIRRELSGDFSNKTSSTGSNTNKPVPTPGYPAQPKPVETKLSEEEKDLKTQEFINDLYAEYQVGTLRFEFIPTGVYDYLKKVGLMKMLQTTTDQIMILARERRTSELKASQVNTDVKLLALYETSPDCDEVKNDAGFLKMAKRLALLELFGQLKARQDAAVFNISTVSE